MKKIFFSPGIVMLFLFPGTLLAQHALKLQGVVYDSLTHKPAKYVNIGILEKGIGTVSSDSGKFEFTIPSDKLHDSLTFSRIGYRTKKLPIAQIQKKEAFFLVRKAIPLHEVEIASKKLKVKEKGNVTHSKSIVLGLSNVLSLGKEVGTLIRLPDKPVYIEDFNFHIVTNNPDSVKFRLNIYSYDKMIGNNLLKRNIYFTVPGKKVGNFKVNLESYHIEVRGNIFVSVEMLKDYVSKGPDPNKKFDKYFYDRLNVSGTITGSKSFYRKVSLGEWEKTGLFSPGFWLTVAY